MFLIGVVVRGAGFASLIVLFVFSLPEASAACGAKKFCKEMRNCAEAAYYLQHCGLKRLDGDSDGISCESKCGKRVSTFQRRWAKQTQGKPLPPLFDSPPSTGAPPPENFSCSSAKRYCRDMDSCAEATFYLKECGRKRLDGNRDGIACNSLCR